MCAKLAALLLPLLAALLASAACAEARRFEAVLAGQVVIPARSFQPAPPDAPESLRTSGKFAAPGNLRSDAPAGTGTAPPFSGQPLQGFSGIRAQPDGTVIVLTDNGFGSRANSPDAMLSFTRLRPDFASGQVEILRTTFLSDPDRVVPFPIAMEGAAARYLTGADLDPEAFQIVGDRIVIGDEFGPYIAVADLATGRLLALHETVRDGALLRSPDHHAMRLGNPDRARRPAALGPELARSRGFEGMALSPDGATLYPLLEGPVWDAEAGDWERLPDGRVALPLLEMAAATRTWTGRSWVYPLEDPRHAIGDFNMIDATRGLVIERDGGQGDAERACGAGQTEGCFRNPAAFKRIYMIDMAGVAPGEPVRKVGYVDLLDIADPDGRARQGARDDGRFTFPFVTVESVDRVGATTIIVGNDNNFPFSRGRSPDAPDDNEFILLEVGAFLDARAG